MIKPTVTYYMNGTYFEFSEIHYWNDIEHNLAGPSSIGYRKNGLRFHEDWKVLGKRHREDGPAVEFIARLSSWDQFWLHGRHHTFEQWIKKVKGKISHDRYEKLKQQYEW